MSDVIGSVEQLVAARQARNISAEDMIRQLKLHPRQLEALERGDWKALPGLPFVRGVVRNYGKVLGVDVEPLLESIGGFAKPADLRGSSTLGTPMPAAGMFGFGSGGSGSRWIWTILVFGGLVALALFFGRNGDLSGVSSWLGGRGGSEAASGSGSAGAPGDGARTESVQIPSQAAPVDAGPGSAPPPAPAQPGTTEVAPGAAPAQAEASAGAAPAAAPAPEKNVTMRLRFDAEAWVDIRQADGKVLLFGTQKAQSVSELDPNGKVTLVIGNAEKVKLEYKGKPMPLKAQPGTGIARLTLQ